MQLLDLAHDIFDTGCFCDDGLVHEAVSETEIR